MILALQVNNNYCAFSSKPRLTRCNPDVARVNVVPCSSKGRAVMMARWEDRNFKDSSGFS